MSVRSPVRLLDIANLADAYPLELLANFTTGTFTLVKSDGTSTVQNKNPGTLTLRSGTNVLLNAADLSGNLDVTIPATAQMTGATADTAGTGGTVPAPAAGYNTRFLRGDGTWVNITYVNNAGTANTLSTSRTLTIGNAAKAFNGSADVSWSLTEIGAAATDHTHAEYVNQNAYSTFKVDANTAAAASATDEFTFVAGSNVTLTLNPTDKTLTIASSYINTTYTTGTTTLEGLTKLYTTTGTAIDGTMTQNAITTMLNTKLNTSGGTISGAINPTTNNSIDLGTSSLGYRTIYATTFSGNATTASRLATAVNIGIGGLTATPASFDGSQAVNINVTGVPASLLTGTVDIARLPAGALERMIPVADQSARFALTTASVQVGDTVKQLDTGVMYLIVDDTNLDNAAGYSEYTAGSATSVPWSGVTDKPTIYQPSTTVPLADSGSGAVGTSTTFARADHVHPLQNSVSGNAGSADKLSTARTLTIGNAAKQFDGSADVSWSLTEIGAAAASHTHAEYVNQNAFATVTVNGTNVVAADTQDALNIAAGSNITLSADNNSKTVTINATIPSYNTGNASTAGLTKLYTATGSNTDGAMTQAAITTALNTKLNTSGGTITGAISPNTNNAIDLGTSTLGYRTVYGATFSGNAATATTLATARTLTIGSSGKTFNGSADVTWTLAEIGAAATSHTHSEYANQNAFSTVAVGSTNAAAASATDTFTIVAGSNVSLSLDSSSKTLTISATDTNTTYSTGTASVAGLTKLYTGTGTATDGTMTQKAINTALSKKLNTSGGTLTGTLTTRALTVASGYTLTITTAGNVSGVAVQYTATISTGSWTGSSAPYRKTISVSGIKATDVPIVDYNPTGTYSTDSAAEEAFMSCIHRVTTAANSITVYVHEKPDVAIPIRLRVIR